MKNAAAASIVVCLSMVSCSGTSGSPVPDGHALALDVALTADSAGELAFLSPSNTIITYAASDIVGKPYLVASFHAGFSPGNDPPIDHEWGVVPADLTVHWATPSTYANGPYDVVFVVYTSTPITSAIEDGAAQSAPAAAGGDLASFTLSTTSVLAGDPKNALGTIRFNVAGANTEVALENRTPADPSNATETAAAFDDTILTIP